MKKFLLILLLPFMAFAQDTIVDPPPPPPPPPVDPIGCTDEEACNFSETAFIDDGTCEYYSCVEPCPDANENGICDEDEEEPTDTLIVPSYDSWINIDIHTDDWPEETSWELVDSNDVAIASGGPYDQDQTLFSEMVELNSGEYYYFLFDSYGDGLWTGGYVEITNTCDTVLFFHEGPFTGYTIDEVMNDGAEWQQNELMETINITPCALPTEGCTDEEANNYDETAFYDDGSCEYNYGCNNENASNYDSLAVMLPQGPIVPGGSCNLEVWGANYFGVDPDWYFDGNQSTFAVGNKLYIGDNTFWVDVVSEYQGNCNAPAVLVYVVTTPEAADGSAGTYTPGTNVNAVVGDYWFMDPCTFIYGCTNPTALNFNPEAGVDDGSCINIPGCTDPASINYNPAATLDDDTCGGGDILCTENKTLLTVEIMLDQYASETSWEIYDNAENLIDEAPQGFYNGNPMGTIVEKQVCVDDNTDIIFFLSDSYGDGLGGAQFGGIDGTWLVYTECGDTISQGQGDFGSLWIDIGTVTPCAPQAVEGCTDDGYLEFDPFANTDDGSCLTEKIYDCTDQDAFNYNPDATAQLENPNCINTLKLYDWADNGWAGSFMVVTQGDDWWGPFTLESDQTEFETEIDLNTDEMVKAYFYSFGQSQQTTEQCRFEIINPIGDVILEGGTNPYINPILSYNQYGFKYQGQALCGNNCIPKVYGCLDDTAVNYDELANTTSNDCYYYPGCTDAAYIEYYNYISDTGVEADEDNGTCEVYAIFGCIDSTAFNYNELATVNQTAVEDDTDPCIPTVLGCTDPLAFNYNIDANTLEPGSCEPVINGCTDDTQFNYDEDANTDNGTCEPYVYGCMDESAFNYDPDANFSFFFSCIAVIEGCTDDTALNYNTAANTEDGSCIPILLGCTDEDALNYNELANVDDESCIAYIYGCTDSTAFNYNILANTDDASCIPIVYGCMDPTQFNYDINANTSTDTCIEFVYGCTDPLAFNYDELANTNVGCESYVYGCTDPEAFNYNPQANTEDDSCEAVVIGCTDDTANNYNELANTNSGCIYPALGCTDPEAFNYDVSANIDDGTCEAVVIGCTDPTALNTDTLANTNSGCIYPILGCTDEEAFNYNSNANTDDGSCEAVIIGCTDDTALNYDETANTNSGCIPYIYGCTDPLAFNYDINANTDDESCVPVVIGCMDDTALNYNEDANTNNGCIPYLYGCTDEEAFNYDSGANTDDGSCIPLIYGCTDSSQFNYNENANTDNGSCIPFVYGCTDDTQFNYNPLANTDNGTCEPVIYGCTDSTALNYNEDANTGDQSFYCIPYVYGCLDPTAFNWNPDANVDNGTCEPVVTGCTNNLAVNYNEEANTDDGSCILIVYGCTDPNALNYNEEANVDNDSCIEIVEGCTDPNAFNYNADANVEDFSCIDVVIGCLDEDAINYDPLANTDSGGCIDVLTGCTDVNAFNYSLTANTDDGSCVYDAGCSGGPGEPYWLPNECFAWVISIDDECCDGEWDSYCVELYNYCDLGWPIELEENSDELLIYPNPVTDILTIKGSSEVDVDIYDMVGNLVVSEKDAKQINMTKLSSGIYNMNILYKGVKLNQKVVKQ